MHFFKGKKSFFCIFKKKKVFRFDCSGSKHLKTEHTNALEKALQRNVSSFSAVCLELDGLLSLCLWHHTDPKQQQETFAGQPDC